MPTKDPTAFYLLNTWGGGVVNLSDAARLCGVSRQRMEQLWWNESKLPGPFPDRVRLFGKMVIPVIQLTAWESSTRKPGRPLETLVRRFPFSTDYTNKRCEKTTNDPADPADPPKEWKKVRNFKRVAALSR